MSSRPFMLPEIITRSRLFRTSLGRTFNNQTDARAAQRLTSSLASFRSKAALLASEIHTALPELTVHDVSHLDSLWEVADTLVGEQYEITPVECYVLGATFLIHDLGMAVASHPGGLTAIRQTDEWKDLEAAERGRAAKSAAPISDVDSAAIATAKYLRALHAKQAEHLARTKLSGAAGEDYLIEDTDIRTFYGRMIGVLAHSHWWSIATLEREFSRVIQPISWCSAGWTLDPLKIAAILRLADYAHIDARRAPKFLRIIRNPSGHSDAHWCFQEKLSKPGLHGDALEYSAGEAFTASESPAWWLCMDTLSAIDRELRAVDSMLADRKMTRFAAKRVAGVESPERMLAYIPATKWIPIDAKIFVSDLPAVVQSLGGNALYGQNPKAAIRELIQNAADAIRARRAADDRTLEWGEIRVRLAESQVGWQLEVNDCGVGMSRDTLTHFLLDFGRTFWGSDSMRAEFPKLQASRFRPTGRYGIGFFSVFMLGPKVSVISRKFDASRDDTWVMEFERGVRARPIVRKAESSEMLAEGGTIVRVELETPPHLEGGLLYNPETRKKNLADLIREVAPALDVTLKTYQSTKQVCLPANYWLTCTNRQFVKHLGVELWAGRPSKADLKRIEEESSKLVSVLKDSTGAVFGRALISPSQSRMKGKINGYVTVGGLAACEMNLAGILVGEPTRASRDTAIPIAPNSVVADWATDQADRIASLVLVDADKAHTAEFVRRLNGRIDKLPALRLKGCWKRCDYILNEIKKVDEFYVIGSYDIDQLENLEGFKYGTHLVLEASAGIPSIINSRFHSIDWPELSASWPKNYPYLQYGLEGLICELAAQAWDTQPEVFENSFMAHQQISCVSVNGKPIKINAHVLKRPKNVSSRKTFPETTKRAGH